MSALGNIIFKEIKELATPATFLPIIVMTFIFASMGNTIGGIEEEMKEPPTIGVINYDQEYYSFIATDVFNSSSELVNLSNIYDKNSSVEEIKEQDGVALIIINENFSSKIFAGNKGDFEIYWIMKGAGMMDSISSSVVEQLIEIINDNITRDLILSGNPQGNATNTTSPTSRIETTYFKNKELPGLTPNQVASLLSSQSTFVPIIMMIIIMMAGQIVISSMALEKENKTLETLLTLPVKRTSIVAGKIIAAAVIGLILAVIYMIGMGYYLSSMTFQGAAGGTLDLSLSVFDFILIGLIVFVSLIFALAFCMFLGTMAKNFKSAQTLTFPIAIMALIPMFIIMFKDFDTLPLGLQAVVFGIPFSHTMMAPRALLFDDYALVISGLIYVTIFALLMIAVVVWIFKTDKIVTGSAGFKWKKYFKGFR